MSRNRRQQRPTPTRPALTTEQIRQLGRELIRELAPGAGDADAVRLVLTRWLGREDVDRLSMVAMSAVQIMFADCLTRTPLGAWTLNPPPERTDRCSTKSCATQPAANAPARSSSTTTAP